nr:hypothetical protein [Tanacetum cinerariifolium]
MLPPPQAPQQSTIEAMMVKRIGELEHTLADMIQVNKTTEERLDKHGARLYTLEQLDIPQQVSIAISEVVTDAVDWAMQAPLCNRFRDLPEADIKEILHQRMWETYSYKSHEDHMQLFEALEKSINRDQSEELAHDLAEARKKRKKGSRVTKNATWVTIPSATSSFSTTDPNPTKTAATTKHQAWSTPDVTLKPLVSLTPEDLDMDEAMGLDEQAQLSDKEDIRSAHIPTVNLRQGWWKPFEEERPTTPEPACVDDPILRHNVSKSLPLGGPPGQVTIQSDFFFNKDLEYLRYGSKGRRPALSISKMKVAYYSDAGLEQMVPDQFWIEEECKYDISSMYGISHWLFQRQQFYIDRHTSEGHLNHLPPKDKKILTTAVNQWTRQLVIRQHVEDFQLGIESYQTQVNLTKPQWMATGFEYKHDYTVIESSRAIIFRDKYGVQMMMRLQQIVEALDYRVKEFRINRMNPGLNTRFWTRKDVDRCNAFMFAIQRRLKTRRIFRNLESFVRGRVREGDYRILKRTD